jgi:hypothetical protein
MGRPVTLFTGQWADLPLADLAAKAGAWGFDGLELTCSGDHFDVPAALSGGRYCAGRRELLERHGLDREWGAPDALAFVRRMDFTPSAVAFDPAFARRA